MKRRATSESIHPRVRGGRTNGEKANTSAAPDPATKARKLAGLRAHAERHPRCGHTATRIAALQA